MGVSKRRITMSVGGYEQYYLRQSQGGGGIPVFHGVGVQQGRGLGNLLNAAFRMIAPGLKSVGKAVLKQGVSTGSSILGDVLSGESLKHSVKRRAAEGGDALMNKAFARAGLVPPASKRPRTTGGGGKKRGGGRKVNGRVGVFKKRGVRRRGPQFGGGRGGVRKRRKTTKTPQRRRKGSRRVKRCVVRRKGRRVKSRVGRRLMRGGDIFSC